MPRNDSTAHVGNGGLMAKSVGELYPWSVRGLGNSLQAFHCITGLALRPWEYNPAIDRLANPAEWNSKGGFGYAYDQAVADIGAEILLAPARQAA